MTSRKFAQIPANSEFVSCLTGTTTHPMASSSHIPNDVPDVGRVGGYMMGKADTTDDDIAHRPANSRSLILQMPGMRSCAFQE